MKKTLLPLAVSLLAAVLILAFRFSGDGDRTRRGGGLGAEPTPGGATGEPATPLPPVSTPAVDPEPPQPRTPPAGEGRRALEAEEGTGALPGRVLSPTGSPPDESLRVLALSEARSAKEVYGSHGVLRRLEEGQRGVVLDGSPVAADGRFVLELPRAERVWLAVDGRFLHSPTLTSVEPGEEVLLRPALGAALSGHVRLPEGTSQTPEVFAAVELELEPDGERLSPSRADLAQLFGRATTVDERGRFEFRAVPTNAVLSLEARSAEAAGWRRSGLELEPGQALQLDVALEVGAALGGRVLDPAGAPLAGAEVHAARDGLFGFPGERLTRTESRADGSFLLQHVPPGKVLLAATHEGYLESEARRLELRNNEQRNDLVLELTGGARLGGRVTGPGGTTPEGVEIEVDFDPAALMGMGAMNAARGAEGRARTDARGRFEVAGLGQGPFRVRASWKPAQETLRARRTGVAPDTLDLELVLEAPARIEGRVVDRAGAPVTRFLVRATSPGPIVYLPGTARQERVEEPQGRFAVDDLEAGTWKLEIEAEDYGPSTPVELELPLPAEAEPLVITLVPAASVAGRVVDPQGQPVAGARVAPELELGAAIQRLRGGAGAECHSDDEGRFVLTGLGSGRLALVAQHAGFAPSEPVAVELEPGQQVQDVALGLRRGALVTGEVWGADGRLASGVRVVAQSPGTMETLLEQTDGRGAFRLENLRPGPWTVTAVLVGQDEPGVERDPQAALLENMRFTMVELADGDEKHVMLGAPPAKPVRVHGRVLHGEEPVGQGLVSFMPQEGRGFEALKIAPLDAQGRYRIELSGPGKYLVSVQITGSGLQQQNVEQRATIPESEDHELDLELPLGGIRGQVRGPDGKPLAGAPVTLGGADGIRSGTLMGGHYAQTSTDGAGQYAFDYLRPGTYAVAAGGALFGGAMGSETFGGRVVRSGLRVEEGRSLEGVDFRLEKPGDLGGRVVDATGSPVAGASVHVRDVEGQVVDRFTMVTSGADGGFRYAGLAPGRYTVMARTADRASPASEAVRVEAGHTSTVDLTLEPGTLLLVELLDGSGAPAEGRLSVLDAQGRDVHGLLGVNEMSRVLGAAGAGDLQRIGPLPPGTYEVTAVDDDGRRASRSVHLDGRPERRLKLRLRD